MIGAASSLKELENDLSPADKQDLVASILEEARRLEGYIQNLLDMTRLGQGELSLNREWIGIDEIINVVVKRAQAISNQHRIELKLEKNLPPLFVHPSLIEQAIFNVLENALKFSPPGSAVTINVSRVDAKLQIDVIDRGPGIPPAQREKIFNMFYTVSRGDFHRAGTGLGLAICQGMLGAHGGSASVIDIEDGGACIRLLLPLTEPEPSLQQEPFP
jgi:two-component system sensor histidine kinase KdpD